LGSYSVSGGGSGEVDMKKEVKRIEDINNFPYEVSCIECGNKFDLHYNGGELDYHYCCGYEYMLEEVQIDFVILKRDGK
jgi:hypothetical protein